ncbi:MAG TPA: DUF5818 domain-containing protein [Bryobacteraceae bacterium]|nr:DUF5818 domain-containing protein [Bryobacteraceae bacterium]
MKKLVLASALFGTALFAAEYKGVISDAGCGAKHADASEKAMKCVEGCVKGKGAAPVLVTEEGKVLKISDKEKVMAHLGHKVVVDGKVSGDTIDIASVKMQ